MKLGTIESLWRYPVKSLMGEQLNTCDLDARGVSGDRLYAISNVDGKFGSGKNTRRFRRIDGLFSMSAQTTANGVSVRFPDGSVLADEDYSLDSELSRVLGQSVSLTKEADIPHFDDGAVHILTTASLSLLKELLPDAGITPTRFRPNIVIDTEYLDQDFVGKSISIGDVIMEITHKTERCRMITLAQQGLEDRPEILRAVSKNYGLMFGVYAQVISTGSVSVGDNVQLVH